MEELTGKQYWRSLDELAGKPEFREWLHREFPENASEMLDGNSRRNFLHIMAASLGLAGLTACRRPVEKILPATKGVEDQIPGNALFYNTVMPLGGTAMGLTVEVHDGRPTKVEGNPKHPASLGATSALAQASVLSLYDPDRSKDVLEATRKSDWAAFTNFAKTHFASLGTGDGLRVLSGAVNSPTLETQRAELLKKFPAAKWVEYEPLTNAEILAGTQIAFGQPLLPTYNLENADVIVALDSDFLGSDCPDLPVIRQFSRRRKSAEMNRLYSVESNFTITGAMADHRLRMRSADIVELAAELAQAVNAATTPLKIMNASEKTSKWVKAVVTDLTAHKGRSVVIAGPRQPAAVHAAAAAINSALGNAGTTVSYVKASAPAVTPLKELAAELNSGKVSTLVMLGVNPVYNAPSDVDFAGALKKVGTAIHLGLENDETAALSKWHLPEAHYMEAWGDARHIDGTVSIQQPLIEPIFGGKSAAELIAIITGQAKTRPFDLVRAQYASLNDKAWRTALHEGIVAAAKPEAVKATVNAAAVVTALGSRKTVSGTEVVFYPGFSTLDGRFANNGWMQETPDPMTKLVWDNAALISPNTMKKLGLEDGDVISISTGGKAVEAPAMTLPGHADDSISVALGYGRKISGRIARNVGFDANPLRTTSAFWIAQADVKKTGNTYKLVTTQEHHSMEGRPIVREGTLEEYKHNPEFAHEPDHHVGELFSIFGQHDYSKGNQWGMVIDLNVCTGCNACAVACQAENNIPIVGKDQVGRGREMAWIRLDRYFTGDVEDPQAVYQPMACQQCETAPCEQVCPVAATNHSPEGLNDMAYNRCVGTRYCANNCPYKVRRFNFLDWHRDIEEVQKAVHNPNVTVRMRGVMEKCTYCVQRIQEAKIKVKAEARRAGGAAGMLKDGDVVTACQQACPAEAIVFGNINDPESRVAKLKREDKRDYVVLKELNTKPRTSYLAKVRNTNSELADKMTHKEEHHG